MEKDLFPPYMGDTSMADRSPRMDRNPDEGIPEGHPNGHGGNGCGCRGYEGCSPDSWGLGEYPLAMVYAPCQMFRGLYDPATALSHGTLFSELNLPLGHEGGGLTALKTTCCRERRQS